MKTLNAQAKSLYLGIEDHGILTAFIHMELEGGGLQGFGGYNLDIPQAATLFLRRCMQIFEVREWKDIAGKPCRVRTDGGLLRGVGHFVKDKWFMIAEEMQAST